MSTGLVRRSGDTGATWRGPLPLRVHARRRRCHEADVLHSVRARKSLPASHDRISFTREHYFERLSESNWFTRRRRSDFVDKWASLIFAGSVVIRMQYNLVVRESAWRHRDRPKRSYVEHGCSDGMWSIVVTCNDTVPLFTWSAVAPPGRKSFTGTMRRKRWARMRRAW